jgi:hypothetical protein
LCSPGGHHVGCSLKTNGEMLALMAIVVKQPPSRKRNKLRKKGAKVKEKRKNEGESSLRGLAPTEKVYIN